MTQDTSIDLEITKDFTMGFLSSPLSSIQSYLSQALSVGAAASLPTLFFALILNLASGALVAWVTHMERSKTARTFLGRSYISSALGNNEKIHPTASVCSRIAIWPEIYNTFSFCHKAGSTGELAP